MEKVTDCLWIVVWCLAVYVCAYDWSEVRFRWERKHGGEPED